VYDVGNELSETGIAKGGSVIFGSPRNDGVDAFYAQFFVVVLHVNLNMLQSMSMHDSIARLPMIMKIAFRKNGQRVGQNQVCFRWVLQVKEKSTSSRTIVFYNITSRYSVSR
jgi:hypothetical protein